MPDLGRVRRGRERARRSGSPIASRRRTGTPSTSSSFGPRCSFASLLEAPPREDERWDPVERTRFGQYALRLWHGLLFHEAVTDE